MKKQLTYIAAAFFFTGMVSAQKIDLNAMPKPGPTPAINIAKPKTFQLSNGLTVMVVENNKLPRVSASLSMDRPPYNEGAVTGVSEIMAEQFENGTTNISKDDFNKKVDYLGANLNFSSGGASANSLSKYFPEVLGLMADAIINPKFSAEEIQSSKERAIEGLKSEEKNASSIAERVSNALMYGKNTSRGEFETVESINKIQLADVQNVYKKYYAPDNAYLVIVGDVKFDQVKPLIEKAFNGWKKANTPIAQLEPASNVAKTEINVVDVPSAVQSVVSLNNLNTLKMKDANYFPATIANYILGGGGEARLFMNLREKNGFTYGAYSSMVASKYSPQFSASASVRNEVTDKAVKEFMNELNAISTVKPEELANAKAKLKGSFIMSLEQPATIARFALNQKVQDLPADFYTNYLKSIDKVTAADVSNAVKATILPNQSRIFIAGKASDISEGLEKLGYPVKYFDKEANPVAKPTVQKVDASVTVASVVDKYINAIGGKANLAKITSYTTNASMSMQGQNIDFKIVKAQGGKELTTVTAMGQVVQKQVFDGKTGYSMQMGQRVDITPEEIAEKQKNPELFEELGFAKSADYKLGGIEKIGGEDSYAIKGGDTTYYYSVATGLKTGETKKVKAKGQEMTIPTTFSNYKDVNGVKMPYTISVSQMGMDMTMTVKSYEINKATDADFK
ncbi:MULTISPECIES: M16 family metallopeptidase [Chryseobacterium]|uniref:M16 family metallopeptidase n=1 Tax=Chryseobacterium TaxID=59732 RepID=UPI00078841B9|nr:MULTISPECIES: pitrilysin family protein [Chryseobacterium]KYH04669.1 peptidase M16 [Chryseobacterium cucumeris]MDH5035771.1 pitrilysin family protein [Chryseobacterium cucumeris]RKE72045.1 putative Zn-dependent peptidase [Chryseobacterium sp. AG363]TXI96198.1 MAG: insulinase family protein [Chryseobacterium cucumeris]WFB67150.1 pitrilysin family protein [Chryseobacterium sp. WX]